jgi:4-amino-4-deoxy-L-arabinose transferase-like glycosyltransferase
VGGRDDALPQGDARPRGTVDAPRGDDAVRAPGSHRREALAVGALVLVALVLRLPTAGVQSFWLDEVYSGRIVDGTLGHAWSTIQRTENTPPLFYLLDWLWTRLFGVSEFGLRSLSAVAGALAVVPVVALTRRLGREDAVVPPAAVALVAGALVAINPLAQWFSQEARSYALLILFAAAAWAALLAAMDAPSRRHLWLWALAAVAATWTHYFGGLLLVVGWGALALLAVRGPMAGFAGRAAPGRRGLAALRPLLPPFVASVLAAAVLLPIAKRQQSTAMYEAIANVKGLGSRLIETPKQFVVGYNGPAEYVLGAILGVAAVVLVLAAAWPRDGRPTRATAVLGMIVAIWVLPLLGLLAGFDVVLTRNYVVLLPPLVALAALGAWRLGRPALIAVGIAGVVQVATIVAVAVTPVYQRDDWRGALRAAKGPGPELLLISHYQEPAATWYEPTLRPQPVEAVWNVRTLALVDRPDEAGEPGPPAAPAPALPPLDPRLKLTRVERDDQFRVYVWTSPVPVPVPPAAVIGLLGRSDRSVVVRP